MLKKISILFMIFIVVANLQGCGSGEEVPRSSANGDSSQSNSQFVEYGVAGHIVEITTSQSDEVIGIIEVKGSENNGAVYTEAIVSVTKDTKIYLNEQTDFNNLEAGMYVNVFFDGTVAESFPVQATAKQINIIPEDVEL